MTRLIVKDLPPLARSVLDRLREGLGSSDDERIQALAQRVPSFAEEERFRLVATGEYNAGKSSILKALTGADIFIDSDVATTKAHPYEWGNVLLVDTPGVRAGVALQDESAERALRDADLVVFVLTVDLFDDVTAAYLRHVAIDLGKLEQTVIVINKADTLVADPALRRAAVAAALGFEPACPIVECAARPALMAATAEPERAEHLHKVGNLDALEEALNDLVRRSGRAGRLKQPFQGALATAREADLLLVPGPEEEVLGKLLARWRAVLVNSQSRLEYHLEEAYRTTRDAVQDAGEVLITAAADGVLPDDALNRFERAAQESADALPGLVEQCFEAELNELASEEDTLAAGPEAQCLVDLGQLTFGGPGTPPESLPVGAERSAFVKSFTDLLTDSGISWLKEALGQGSKPGSPMHKLVGEVGHRLRHKFKPYGIIKSAERLNFVISTGLMLFEVWSEIRSSQGEEARARAQQVQLRHDINSWAEELIEAQREGVGPVMEWFYAEVARPVDEKVSRLHKLVTGREATRQAIDDVRLDCDTALALLDAAGTEVPT